MVSFSSFQRAFGISALLVCNAAAFGEVLATRIHAWSGTGQFSAGMTIQNGGYQWQIFKDKSSFFPDAIAWESVRFTAANVGATFEMTSANDPMFSQATALLSNGLPNTVAMLGFVFASAVNGSESQGDGILVSDRIALFSTAPNTPIDLAGYEILAMQFRLDLFRITTTPAPNGGTAFQHNGQVSITIEGRVPEPATLSSFVLASGCLMFRRRASDN